MFCAVMQDPALCKKLLNFVLADSVGTITEVYYQTTFERGSSKGIRLDIWARDEKGKLYDIEMQTTDQKNLAKRLRYYQSAIDVGTLNKGGITITCPTLLSSFLYVRLRECGAFRLYV